MSWNELKKLSTADLENLIGEAVSKAMNDNYACSISKVNYDTLGRLEARIEIYSSTPEDLACPE